MKLFQPIKNGIISKWGGTFGFIRKFDIHTGMDIYCNNNDTVYAICDGVVTNISNFTGESVGSPWWEETQSIIISTDFGKMLYGELTPYVNIGDHVKGGQIIGNIKRVLKKDKGLPMDMLHFELYDSTYDGDGVIWNLESEKPDKLVDPTNLLKLIY